MRLDEYYHARDFSPTFADFRDDAQLRAYAAQRTAVFRDRLHLPPALFDGLDVLEFGPDTGENALVFASWGARMTLVEPNDKAHAAIGAYFARFGLADRLQALHRADVLAYRDERRYPLIVAEGFIHTVRPLRAWLDRFRALLLDEGMFFVNYYERFGGMVELALRALFAFYRRATGLEPVAAAEALFRPKWDAIPHTRSFASWVLDVLDNPHQSLATFVAADAFVDELVDAGFDLYASWPRYDDGLGVEWHKRVAAPLERAARAKRHLARSTFSFLSGTTVYAGDDALALAAAGTATELLGVIDGLVLADDPAAARRAAALLLRLAELVHDPAVLVHRDGDRVAAADAFVALARAFDHVAAGAAAALRAQTCTDAAFIATWGAPNHLVVARAVAAAGYAPTAAPASSASTAAASAGGCSPARSST